MRIVPPLISPPPNVPREKKSRCAYARTTNRQYHAHNNGNSSFGRPFSLSFRACGLRRRCCSCSVVEGRFFLLLPQPLFAKQKGEERTSFLIFQRKFPFRLSLQTPPFFASGKRSQKKEFLSLFLFSRLSPGSAPAALSFLSLSLSALHFAGPRHHYFIARFLPLPLPCFLFLLEHTFLVRFLPPFPCMVLCFPSCVSLACRIFLRTLRQDGDRMKGPSKKIE